MDPVSIHKKNLRIAPTLYSDQELYEGKAGEIAEKYVKQYIQDKIGQFSCSVKFVCGTDQGIDLVCNFMNNTGFEKELVLDFAPNPGLVAPENHKMENAHYSFQKMNLSKN